MIIKIVKNISRTFSGVVGRVGSLPRWFPLFSFFCLLVSSVSDFRPDTRGWWTLFLGSLVQSRCGEGGTLQTNNTGVCSQSLSHTGPASAHSTHSSGSRLLCRNHPRLALGCMHVPGLSRSGSSTQVVLRSTDSSGPVFCAFPRSE